MRPESAVLAKYAANAFLAARVAFINEVADVAGRVGADGWKVARAMGLDPRIGPHYLALGPGFGGPCLPKDVAALAALARTCGIRPHLLEGMLARNREQPAAVVRLVERAAGGLAGRTVAAWGLAFKAGTDDLRESPAVAVIRELSRKGANVRAHDPAVLEADRPELNGVNLWEDPLEAADGADVLVVLTEWGRFCEADFAALRSRMARPRIVDARVLLDREQLLSLGFEVWSVGVAASQAEALQRSH